LSYQDVLPYFKNRKPAAGASLNGVDGPLVSQIHSPAKVSHAFREYDRTGLASKTDFNGAGRCRITRVTVKSASTAVVFLRCPIEDRPTLTIQTGLVTLRFTLRESAVGSVCSKRNEHRVRSPEVIF